MAVLIPRDAQDLCAIVAQAGASAERLELRGGGSRADFGAPRQATVVSLQALSGVVDYDPAELVLTLRPGTPLAEVQALVASEGQMLAFEPHGAASATIGGTVAAGVAGSRRVTAGSARDHLLGFAAVSGRGETYVAGAKVVKNVTGYDLPKLMAGSWGRIGAMTEMTLKVLPSPRIDVTLAAHGLLALDHLQVHQFTGRVVDVDQQRALRAAVLKPPVLRSINLDQLAAAIAAIAWLVRAWPPRVAILPQAGRDHQFAQRLVRNHNAMAFSQILGRERRAKVRIMLAHQ